MRIHTVLDFKRLVERYAHVAEADQGSRARQAEVEESREGRGGLPAVIK